MNFHNYKVIIDSIFFFLFFLSTHLLFASRYSNANPCQFKKSISPQIVEQINRIFFGKVHNHTYLTQVSKE